MVCLNVVLPGRDYPIHIDAGLLQERTRIAQAIPAQQIMIVTNTRVGPLYLDSLVAALTGRQIAHVTLPDGEAYKTLESFERIITALLEARFDRCCTIIALGGGVVGDIAGFAAASYQRGVQYVQVPTSLLAQVDSSVGGKTGVNHPHGKNMIGAFHQPIAVFADLCTLRTLDEREYRAGIAEIIKYGLIGDREFFEWLESNIDALLGQDAEALRYAVKRSCENKAKIVAADEKESGVRALLNLGHTFGHALENTIGYGTWLHGEAVAAGICMAAEMSVREKCLSEAERQRIVALFTHAGLPVEPPAQLSAAAVLRVMQVDKKNRDGQIRLVLMSGLGHAVSNARYELATLEAVLAYYCEA